MKEKELTPYYQGSYGDSNGNGFQVIYFYTTYHGIPHFIGNHPFRHELESELGEVEDGAVAPHSMVAMRIKRPGEFWTNIYTSKEVGVDIDDIPLLPFDPIDVYKRQPPLSSKDWLPPWLYTPYVQSVPIG